MREKLLHTLVFTPISDGRWGLPMLLEGKPGCGKSAMLEQFARKWGLPCEILSPGERGEGAFGVTPVPSADMCTLHYPPPDWTTKFSNGGVVLVDELSLASPTLQQPLLGLIQARRIGSHTLGKRVRILGATNPVELSTGGWDITPAVANRLGHWSWDAPTAEEWGDWLLSGGENTPQTVGNALDEEARVLSAWPVPWAKACGVVSGFVRRKPNLLHAMPPSGSPDLSKAWPSHRSFENATRALASAEVHNLTQVDRESLVAAFIGRGAASELFTWFEQADLPDPADVLDGKVQFKPDARRLDRNMAVYASCAALVAPPQADKRHDRAASLWRLLDLGRDKGIDVIVPAVKVLINSQLMHVTEARPVLVALEPVLVAAGMTGKRR